jgi:hypothetical protein
LSWLFLVLHFNLIPTSCFYFRTIPTNNAQCRNFDCSTDFEYGMNEDLQSYKTCARRLRNKGLFTADQVIVLPFCFCFFLCLPYSENVVKIVMKFSSQVWLVIKLLKISVYFKKNNDFFFFRWITSRKYTYINIGYWCYWLRKNPILKFKVVIKVKLKTLLLNTWMRNTAHVFLMILIFSLKIDVFAMSKL